MSVFRALATRPLAPPAEIDGVPVKVSARAKRMALRSETRTGQIVLVLPQRRRWTKGVLDAARRFIADNRDWIHRHDRTCGDDLAPAPGRMISVLGRDYVLTHEPGRGLCRFEGDALIVTGQLAHFRRRLRDFLKKEAAVVLPARAAEKAVRLGLAPREVRLRDPATRWGSCGPDGRIMLSWRLILTPEDVMDYVVAHEVAHRVHLDHSRDFWKLCLSLTPNGTAARRWLRRYGMQVMQV